MKTILGMTNELSQALQGKDEDIINTMIFVKVLKQRLQMMMDEGWWMKDEGWESLVVKFFFSSWTQQLQMFPKYNINWWDFCFVLWKT